MWPTIIVATVLAAVIVVIIACRINNFRKGKGSHCGSCAGCAMKDICHSDKEQKS